MILLVITTHVNINELEQTDIFLLSEVIYFI